MENLTDDQKTLLKRIAIACRRQSPSFIFYPPWLPSVETYLQRGETRVALELERMKFLRVSLFHMTASITKEGWEAIAEELPRD